MKILFDLDIYQLKVVYYSIVVREKILEKSEYLLSSLGFFRVFYPRRKIAISKNYRFCGSMYLQLKRNKNPQFNYFSRNLSIRIKCNIFKMRCKRKQDMACIFPLSTILFC